MFSEVGKGTGRPQIGAPARVMMLIDDAPWKASKVAPARAIMLAGRAHAHDAGQGGNGRRIRETGGGGGRAGARAPLRPLPPLRAFPCPPPNE